MEFRRLNRRKTQAQCLLNAKKCAARAAQLKDERRALKADLQLEHIIYIYNIYIHIYIYICIYSMCLWIKENP